MKKYDLISSMFWMTVGGFFCVGGIRYGIGTLQEPGVGFFPFWMSVCLTLFSSLYLIHSLKRAKQPKIGWPERDGIRKILLTILLLAAFVIGFNYLGFVLTTVLFMILVLRLVEPQRWIIVFTVTIVTTGLSYAIFKVWLQALLPVGFLGF